MINDEVRAWCRRQCEIQHATTDEDFAGMEAAWQYAAEGDGEVTIGVIRDLGWIVDPAANLATPGDNPTGQFRKGPAVFMDGGTAAPATEIERKISELCASDGLPAWFFYRELMYIHPFKDGNGRVGALVYNMLNGTILNPVDPPEYK